MIICLVGKQRAGKDTVADYLVKHYGFKKLSLADKVKEIARDLFLMEGKDRELLIKIGMKMREVDPLVWVNYLIRKIVAEGAKDVVIPDVRFNNEVTAFDSLNAVFFKIHAPYALRSRREGYSPDHEFDRSETELDWFDGDFFIRNETTFDDLYKQVDDCMWQLGRKRK